MTITSRRAPWWPAWTALVAALAGVVLLAPTAAAAPAPRPVLMAVTGQVTTPQTYSPADLAALPQAAYPVLDPGRGPVSVTGAALLDVVTRSSPLLPPGKNPQLRVLVTVTGRAGRAVTFALGELDPSFGAHPAVLTSTGSTIELVVPGDRNRFRTVESVTAVRVDVPATTPSAVSPGSITVTSARRTVTLDARLLAALPARTRTVTFTAGTAPQTHTETGPPLLLVLLAAGIVPTLDTGVVAVGNDGYGAAVTPGETVSGGRPLLLSTVEDGTPLAQPRLVPDGDVKGGRYVSGVVTLEITGGPR